jgi:ParB family chromosome partitioning protein
VQPLVVRPVRGEHESYEIVAGERRWRAAQRANLHEVPVVVRALSDQEAIEIAIIENVQREDLNAVEEAEGYRLLMDGHGYTQEDLSKVIGKSRSHLANTLRLLKLPESVQALLRSGALSAGHARCLIGRADAVALAERIVNEGLTVRQVEALVQDKPAAPGKGRKTKAKNADTRAAESELKEALGLDVDIRSGRGEKGELRIRYTSFDQLEDLRHRLLRRPAYR